MFGKKKHKLSLIPVRHPGLALREDMMLLVIDVQERFEPVIPEFDQIVKNIKALIKSFQMYELPVFVTEQYPKGLGKTVKEIAGCFKIMEMTDKITFSCMQDDHFVQKLSKMECRNMVVCGIESHVCVHQTVHDLIATGFKVWTVKDAMGSRKHADYEVAMARMLEAGVTMTTTEMLLFEMAGKAGTESFKQIQELIK